MHTALKILLGVIYLIKIIFFHCIKYILSLSNINSQYHFHSSLT